MAMKVTVEAYECPTKGLWLAKLSPTELSMIGTAGTRVGPRSILGLNSVEISNSRGISLTFQPLEAHLLNLGSSDECLLIDLAHPGALTVQDSQSQRMLGTDENQEKSFGDSDFLRSCAEEGLPPEMLTLASDFLSGVREFADDQLYEGLNRKWVTKPRNFLAITIQNRNKQFCIHVKKSNALERLGGILDIRDDRPGYARFWLKSREQLESAVKAARYSVSV